MSFGITAMQLEPLVPKGNSVPEIMANLAAFDQGGLNGKSDIVKTTLRWAPGM